MCVCVDKRALKAGAGENVCVCVPGGDPDTCVRSIEFIKREKRLVCVNVWVTSTYTDRQTRSRRRAASE